MQATTAGKQDSAAARAALSLGQMLLNSGDAPAAIESFRMAARSGEAIALTMLGRIHDRGWGVAPDPVQAADWFRRAVDAGEPWAMFNLADLHLSGRGVTQDSAAAHGLYAQAAQHGHVQALNMLGMLAESGSGPDPADTAEEYFRAGAEAGDPWAMFNLARRMIEAGCVESAHGWLERSFERGFPDYWRAMATGLAGHSDSRLRALAARAHERAGFATAPVAPAPDHHQEPPSC